MDPCRASCTTVASNSLSVFLKFATEEINNIPSKAANCGHWAGSDRFSDGIFSDLRQAGIAWGDDSLAFLINL